MAENYNEGDLSLDSQGGEGGVSESAREAFRENLKKSQAAVKKIKKDEGKAKIYDTTLAHLLTTILQQGGQDQLVLLSIELIESNVPSDFILSVLSLQFTEANKQATKAAESAEKGNALVLMQQALSSEKADFFSSNIQLRITQWGDLIIQNAIKDAEKVLETVIKVETWEIHPSLVTLSALLLQQYAKEESVNIELSEVKEFSQNFFQKLLDTLQDLISSQEIKTLTEA